MYKVTELDGWRKGRPQEVWFKARAPSTRGAPAGSSDSLASALLGPHSPAESTPPPHPTPAEEATHNKGQGEGWRTPPGSRRRRRAAPGTPPGYGGQRPPPFGAETVPFQTRWRGGEEARSPGPARGPREAAGGCAPRPPHPGPCAQGRPQPPPAPHGTPGPRPRLRAGRRRPPAATQLPGGGAAHRASIRERRRGREEGREEEAGFKRKAVTPHKRFL